MQNIGAKFDTPNQMARIPDMGVSLRFANPPLYVNQPLRQISFFKSNDTIKNEEGGHDVQQFEPLPLGLEWGLSPQEIANRLETTAIKTSENCYTFPITKHPRAKDLQLFLHVNYWRDTFMTITFTAYRKEDISPIQSNTSYTMPTVI